MSDNQLAKAVIIAGGMVAWSLAFTGFGAAGFLFSLIGIAGGGYLAAREFWGIDVSLNMPGGGGDKPEKDDPVADRFR